MVTPVSVRLAVFGVDGLLPEADQPLLGPMASALRKLQERGIELAFAGSRHSAALALLAGRIGVRAHRISCNGALVEHRDGRRLQRRRFRVGTSLAGALAAYVEAGGVMHLYDQDERWHAYGRPAGIEREERAAGLRARTRAELPAVPELAQRIALKIACAGDAPGLAHLHELVPGRGDLALLDRGRQRYDIQGVDAGRGAGLRVLIGELAIEPAQVAAFGDGDADAAMLALAGHGLAVGAAGPRARAAASEQVDAAAGLEHWLQRLQLAAASRQPLFKG